MVSRENQVLLLQTIEFFVPGIGCVGATLTYPPTRKLLNTQLDAFLADGKLDQLRALDRSRRCARRASELLGAVQTLKKAPEYLEGEEAVGDRAPAERR